MKLLIKLTVVLIVLVVAALLAAAMYVDSIAKSTIERAGTYALGVETTLDSAIVGIRAGTFELAGLAVANPPGFDEEHIFSLADGSVAVSFGSLREDVVRLPHLRLTGFDMSLQKKDGKANYTVIMENIKRLESGEKPTEPTGEDGKRFIIEEVTISDVAVRFDLLPIGGELTRKEVKVQEIKLKNVGSGSDSGVLIEQLLPTLLKAVMAAVMQEGGGIIPGDILGDLKGQLGSLDSLSSMGVEVLAGSGGDLTAVSESLTERLGDLPGDIGKEAGDAIKGLGDLLGGGDKDKDGD